MRADCLPHAQVTIRVDDPPLEEHLTEGSDDAMTATCFVETDAGSEFSVKLNLDRIFSYKKDLLVWAVHLNGKRRRSQTIELNRVSLHGLNSEIRGTRSTTDGETTSRNFMFAALETTVSNHPLLYTDSPC